MLKLRTFDNCQGESSAVQSKFLVALVAASLVRTERRIAGMARTRRITIPRGVKVESGATAPQFPGNEGVGKEGDNSTKAAQDFATSQLGIPGGVTSATTQLVTEVVISV